MKALSQTQLLALDKIARCAPIMWSGLWRTRAYGHPWTLESLARRGLIYPRNVQWDGDDYELWAVTEAGHLALSDNHSSPTKET